MAEVDTGASERNHFSAIFLVACILCGPIAGLLVSLTINRTVVSSPVYSTNQVENKDPVKDKDYVNQNIGKCPCPEGYFLLNFGKEYCYRFRPFPANGHQAELLCKKDGANLVYFDDIQEYNGLAQYITMNEDLRNPSIVFYWLGAKLDKGESPETWKWMHNNMEVKFTIPWNMNEPTTPDEVWMIFHLSNFLSIHKTGTICKTNKQK